MLQLKDLFKKFILLLKYPFKKFIPQLKDPFSNHMQTFHHLKYKIVQDLPWGFSYGPPLIISPTPSTYHCIKLGKALLNDLEQAFSYTYQP
jgi:hypothetical protein